MHSSEKKNIEDDFLNFCESENLLFPSQHILVCVSGGVDSMVLLHLLWKFKVSFKYTLSAAHFNHLTRNGASDDDEKLVRNYCHQIDTNLYTERADVETLAGKMGISFEMAGRRLRYQFFEKTAREIGNATIATAHIQSDNTETILMRMINGTGLHGLTGIEVKRKNIIRPLMFAQKANLYQYAEINKIPYHDDHTNFENEGQRNVIRNTILPEIRKHLNPNIDNNMDNFSKIILEYLSFIKKIVRKQFFQCAGKITACYLEFDIEKLKNLESIIRKEMLLAGFHEIDNKINNYPSFHYMQRIEDLIFSSDTGRYIEPYKNVIVLVNREKLIILNKKNIAWEELEIRPGKIYTRDSFIFSSKFIKFEDFISINNSRSVEYIDADKISGKLRLRHWQQGDNFSPLGSQFKKKLSDFFIDNKIPRFLKDHIPILWDEEKIIWVCGMQISDDVKITKKTRKILKLEYKEL
ncbi:MAG: tRNA lysidine(34) synthetase TilS [Fidelibacterota bacterium]